MECNFSKLDASENKPDKIKNDLVAHCDEFRYLGSMVESQEGFNLR